jgi:hypothetical protein
MNRIEAISIATIALITIAFAFNTSIWGGIALTAGIGYITDCAIKAHKAQEAKNNARQ